MKNVNIVLFCLTEFDMNLYKNIFVSFRLVKSRLELK